MTPREFFNAKRNDEHPDEILHKQEVPPVPLDTREAGGGEE